MRKFLTVILILAAARAGDIYGQQQPSPAKSLGQRIECGGDGKEDDSATIPACAAEFVAADEGETVGFFEGVRAGELYGWAYCPKAPSARVCIEFYVDGPRGDRGVLTGTAMTSICRPELNKAKNLVGDHGFVWEIPLPFRKGNHRWYAYADDPDALSERRLLMNSPHDTPLYIAMEYEPWFPGIPGCANVWKPRWGTPLLGTYSSKDPVVIDKHAEWFHALGVDVALVDMANNSANDQLGHRVVREFIESNARSIFAEYDHLSALGKPHPKLAVILGAQNAGDALASKVISSGDLQEQVNGVHADFVRKYPHEYFEFQGKPLLLIYMGVPGGFRKPPDWNDGRFTVRWMGGYLESQPFLYHGDLNKNVFWSWYDRTPIPAHAVAGGPVEAVTVTQAYPGTGWLDTVGNPREGTPPARGRRSPDGQSTFSLQWNRAIAFYPQMIVLNQWNEFDALQRTGDQDSGDQYSPEYSNDLEPSVEFGYGPIRAVQQAVAAWKGVQLPAIDGTTPNRTQHVIMGFLDPIAADGHVSGWVIDFTDPLREPAVRLYLDGPSGKGQIVAQLPSSVYRPNVNRLRAVSGNHGFKGLIPATYRDGKRHSVYAYALALTADGTNEEELLHDSPQTWAFPASGARARPLAAEKCP